MLVKFRKALTWLRDAWLILGIIVAFFLLTEIVLYTAYAYRKDNPVSDSRAFADTYQNADWPSKYYEEFSESCDIKWLPYVYWRRKPYQGQLIDIDSQGIRKTWSSKFGRDMKGIRSTIFLFGGSTMWGTGARNDFTIPSLFAKLLATNRINAQIINYGESGYVNTQEVILLIRELQKGNIPDLVVFYDGVNDTFSACQQQIAGIPQNEFNRVKEFSTSNTDIWSPVANNLLIIRFIKGVFRRLGSVPASENAAQHISRNSLSQSITNEETLADDVLNIYEKNIEIVKSLAECYSFKALFYWQPTIFEKKNRTEYEEKEMRKHLDVQQFFDMTYGLLRRRDFIRNGKTGFHDLSMLFSDLPEPLFVDWCHLGETGNGYIAKKLVIDAIPIIRDRLSAEQGAVAAELWR